MKSIIPDLSLTDRVYARLSAFPLAGFALTLCGCLSMGAASALIKSNRSVDVFLTASVRNMVVFALAAPGLFIQGTSMRLRGREGRLVFLRAFVSTVGVLIFFYSFRNIPLGKAYFLLGYGLYVTLGYGCQLFFFYRRY